MFCPRCRTEYVEGVGRCDACDLDLVEALEPLPTEEPAWVDLVTVLETLDPTRASVVRALLEAEEIPCAVADERTRHALGLIGGEGPLGLWRIQVPAELADAARALIADRGAELAEGGEPPEASV